MTTKEHDLAPAIALLESQYVDAQKAADSKLGTLNSIREAAGLPPRQPGIDGQGANGGQVLTQIKRDTFYGKKQMTAIREYLTMRRAQGDGPATPREVLDALKAGGYRFETKSDDIALVGVRALLRKANNVFHKLPGTGSYGLLEWYPNAKLAKDDEDESPRSRPKKGNRPHAKKRGRPKKTATADDEGDSTDTETAAD